MSNLKLKRYKFECNKKYKYTCLELLNNFNTFTKYGDLPTGRRN